jgi:para-aminobenzoate synthetase component 1
MLWGNQFEEAIYLDSNQNQQVHQNFEALLAIEAFTAIKSDHKEAFLRLDEYQHTTQDWLFGYMSYDLKNDTEHLTSQNQDQLSFPELYFIQPKKIWILKL